MAMRSLTLYPIHFACRHALRCHRSPWSCRRLVHRKTGPGLVTSSGVNGTEFAVIL